MKFDFEHYRFTIDSAQNPPWHMDERHIGMLFDTLAMHEPGNCIEIGSYRGASTSAFVEALNAGYIKSLTCIDPHPTPELHAVLAKVRRGLAKVLPKPSTNVTLDADFIFIDGDHGWPAIYEVGMAIARDTPIIAMHDTRGHYNCGGSALAAEVLRAALDREFVEDFETRAGEFTHRGFMVSVRK